MNKLNIDKQSLFLLTEELTLTDFCVPGFGTLVASPFSIASSSSPKDKRDQKTSTQLNPLTDSVNKKVLSE